MEKNFAPNPMYFQKRKNRFWNIDLTFLVSNDAQEVKSKSGKS